MSDQLEFDLFGEKMEETPSTPKPQKQQPAPPAKTKPAAPFAPPTVETTPAGPPALPRRALERAVLAWLVREEATGIALQVPTRISNYQADLAAFWSQPVRTRTGNGPCRIQRPRRTLIVELRRTRKECWPDCSNSDELTPQLLDLRRRQAALQQQIRDEEPELQRTDMLFEEFAEWEYNLSENEEYHRICRQIRKVERALYKGTKFEKLACACLADEAYLAVPAGTVQPHEVASGWGLLWVDPDWSVQVREPAPRHSCTDDNRLHLVQNIGQCSRRSVLFANGIHLTPHGPVFAPVPHRRRPKARD